MNIEGAISGIGTSQGGLNLSQVRSPTKSSEAAFTPELGSAAGPQISGTGNAPDFGSILNRFVEGVNQTQMTAEAETRNVLMGNSDNLHQAMMAGEESGLALRLMVEVRNKLVEGFQEIMRMQV